MPEQLGLGEADETEPRALEPHVGAAHQDGQRLRPEQGRDERRLALEIPHDLLEPVRRLGVGGEEAHPEALAAPRGERGLETAELPADAVDRARLEAKRARRVGHEHAALHSRAVAERRERGGLRRAGREQARIGDRHRGVGRQVVAESRPVLRRPGQHRENEERRDRAGRPLGGRIERPERLDVVSRQLEPDGQRSRWREDVDDPAPERPLADARHGLHALVAGGLEVLDEGLAVDRVARGHRQDLAPKRCRRGKRCLEAARGHDHPEGLPAQEAAQDPGAARILLARPRIAPEGGVRDRHQDDLAGRLPTERRGEGAEVVEGPERRRLIGHDHDRGTARRQEPGQRERRRGPPQALEPDPLRAPRQRRPGRGRGRPTPRGCGAAETRVAVGPLTGAPGRGGRTDSPARSTGRRSAAARPSAP